MIDRHDDEVVHALPLVGNPPRRRMRTAVCAEDGCETRLSMYNLGSHCAAHQRPDFRLPRRSERPARVGAPG